MNQTEEVGFSIIPQAMKPTTMSLSFFPNAPKELTLTPAALDCHKLRILLIELKEMELFQFTPMKSDIPPLLYSESVGGGTSAAVSSI